MASARKVVVLTGATSGIGRATAAAFARRGCRIGLIARGEDGLRATLADVERSGGEGLVLQADVSNAAQVCGRLRIRRLTTWPSRSPRSSP